MHCGLPYSDTTSQPGSPLSVLGVQHSEQDQDQAWWQAVVIAAGICAVMVWKRVYRPAF